MDLTLREKLTKILIDAKLITYENLLKALEMQKERGGSLGDILVSLGLITRDQMMMALSEGLGIPPINLSRFKIEPEILKIIPSKIAKHYQLIPISKIGSTLTVAMADPVNIFALDGIKSFTGLKIAPLITTDKDIQEAIEKYYSEDASLTMDKIVDDMSTTGSIEIVDDQFAPTSESSVDLLQMTQAAPVIKLTNSLLTEGVSLKASDILIESLSTQMRVRYRIDGILREGRRAPKPMHKPVVSRLKVMAELNISEHRLPQDGRFKVRLHSREVDFRISVLPANEGEKVVLRILDKQQAMLDLEKLGFLEEALTSIKQAAAQPHGLILVSGPTGCGKTTTLYGILKHVDSPADNLTTVEDPVEYLLSGINQVTARPDIGLTFASALRAILRQDPDVVMIGEIRDAETVGICIKAALTGHLVLSSVHTTTAAGTVIRLINMGAEPFLIISSLILVVSQRLVRRICERCKEPITIPPQVLESYGLTPEQGKQTFYRGKGCDACFKTGYKGRDAIAEVLTMTPKIRDLIMKGAQEHQLTEQARKEGMKSIYESGIRKVLAGVTTFDEILRVTVGDQDASGIS